MDNTSFRKAGLANPVHRIVRYRERYETVEAFLLAMGACRSTAIADSEGIEHHVNTETLRPMKRILKTRSASA